MHFTLQIRSNNVFQCILTLFSRYAHNYIFALSETLKLLENQEVEPEADGKEMAENRDLVVFPTQQQQSYSEVLNTTLTYSSHTDLIHSNKFKAEPAWQFNTSTCLQYPSQKSGGCSRAGSGEYDSYSESSYSPQSSACSPQSGSFGGDWNGIGSEGDESPTKYDLHHYHHYLQPGSQAIAIPSMSEVLAHCH